MTFMTTTQLTFDSLPQAADSRVIPASSLRLDLGQTPKKFYRHGWQSWSLTTWLDLRNPPLPVRAAEFRNKDEDRGYALHPNHLGAWVGAVELGEDDIVLLGALDLGGRIELDDTTLHGFYEDQNQNAWLIVRGKEDAVFSEYAKRLETQFGKGRVENPPRVWCS